MTGDAGATKVQLFRIIVELAVMAMRKYTKQTQHGSRSIYTYIYLYVYIYIYMKEGHCAIKVISLLLWINRNGSEIFNLSLATSLGEGKLLISILLNSTKKIELVSPPACAKGSGKYLFDHKYS